MYRIIFLLALYGLTSTFSSGLSGYILRYFSPQRVVIIGELMKASGMILMLWSTRQSDVNIILLTISQVIGGVGFTTALTTDSILLRRLTSNDQKKFMRIQTTSQSGMFIATLFAGSAGSILYEYNPQWPFIAAIVVSILSSFFVMAMHVNDILEPIKVSDCITSFSPTPEQSFWMYFYSISRAFTLAPFIGFIPYYFITVNVDPVLFGAVLSCFTLSSWIAIKISSSIISRYGIISLLIITSIMMSASMAIFSSNEWLASNGIDYFISGLLALILLGFGSGVIRPLTLANLDVNDNSPKERIYIFSKMERDFGIANAILLALGAWLLVNKGFSVLMIYFCFSYIAISYISINFHLKRSPSKDNNCR